MVRTMPAEFGVLLATGLVLLSRAAPLRQAPLHHVLQQKEWSQNDDDNDDDDNELTLCGEIHHCRKVLEWCDEVQPSCESCEEPCGTYYPPTDIHSVICKQNCPVFYQQTVDKKNQTFVIELVGVCLAGFFGLSCVGAILCCIFTGRCACTSMNICHINKPEEQQAQTTADDTPLLNEDQCEPSSASQEEQLDDRPKSPDNRRRQPQRLERRSSKTAEEHEESNQAPEPSAPKAIDEPQRTQPRSTPEEQVPEEGGQREPEEQDDQAGSPAGELEPSDEPGQLEPHGQHNQRQVEEREQPGEQEPEDEAGSPTGELEPHWQREQESGGQSEAAAREQPRTPEGPQPRRQRERDKAQRQGGESDCPDRTEPKTVCPTVLQGQQRTDIPAGSCLKGPIHKETRGSQHASSYWPAQPTTPPAHAIDYDETVPKELGNSQLIDKGQMVEGQLRGNASLEDQDDLKAEDPDEHQSLTQDGEPSQETPLKTVGDSEFRADSFMSLRSTCSTTCTVDLGNQHQQQELKQDGDPPQETPLKTVADDKPPSGNLSLSSTCSTLPTVDHSKKQQ